MEDSLMTLLINGFWETIAMTFISCFFGYLIGLPTGILLFLTRKGQMLAHPVFHSILGFCVNVFRSIPFIILIVWMIPFTRNVVGTSIGVQAALVPLSLGVAPFIARLTETSLLEVPSGLIEVGISMGSSAWQLTKNILLPEALPSIVQNITITLITLVGYSAMGGAVGAGGLGQIGYQYGYIGYDSTIMNSVIVILIAIVIMIQFLGNFIAKKVDHR
ncbi:methionine ABC transporter permease MetI [Rhizosphaericola mali]|uniref:D-methionine transport system permease protein MetI n=1 Tax=Rhizosphaericola mali TaxID=2545455 RepID=A0A5P2FYU9_9BACT|nr:methionine ABC transporter permease MetI [Rhizosphaericola mali]QES88375.1 methionine ABC transporter permease MetI [Rhizosphaericola mali]